MRYLYKIHPQISCLKNKFCHVTGVEEQLSYFHDIGINAIWLSPIYKSPMLDMGYDISNFTDVDPIFGTMGDFDSLVRKVKEFGN